MFFAKDWLSVELQRSDFFQKTASIPLLIVRIAEVANLISTHSFKEGTKNFFVCKFG